MSTRLITTYYARILSEGSCIAATFIRACFSAGNLVDVRIDLEIIHVGVVEVLEVLVESG